MLRVARRSAGIVVMVASFSACSPEPSRKAEQDPKLRGSLALQLTEAEKLAKKEKDREGALQFVRLAQEACKELSGKTVALTDSTGDLSAMNSLIPPEFYPSESFAAYVDGATFEEVKSQLNQVVGSLVELLRALERNKDSVGRQPDAAIRGRAALQEGKLKALATINTYCESVRRAGAGVGSLR